MGLFDRFLGKRSIDARNRDQDDQEHIPVTQFFFVGNEIQSDPLNESMLVLRQGPPVGDDVGDNSWEWSVVKCNETLEVGSDMDVHLCVYREGSLVDLGEAFQSHFAWMLSKEEIGKLSTDDSIIRSFPFPDDLRDEAIPEGTRWEKQDLESLLLPFQF